MVYNLKPADIRINEENSFGKNALNAAVVYESESSQLNSNLTVENKQTQKCSPLIFTAVFKRITSGFLRVLLYILALQKILRLL